MKKITKVVKLYLKGFCMGVADVIPGVSGGTIAFLFGIYEELISSIKSVNLKFLKDILLLRWKTAFEVVNWRFLLVLVSGIVSAIILMSGVLHFLLANYPAFVFSFFFGLVLATIPILIRIIPRWTVSPVILLIISAVFAFFISSLSPIEAPHTALLVFLSGAVAICAMILPGISGAFILLLLGQYNYILNAVHERNFLVVAIFILGIAVGLFSFVRLLSWLFKKYHDATIAILAGFVMGSLQRIWPWKEPLGHEETNEMINVFPAEFGMQFCWMVGLIVLGFVFTLMLNKSERTNLKNLK